jgi:hypothetical protein
VTLVNTAPRKVCLGAKVEPELADEVRRLAILGNWAEAVRRHVLLAELSSGSSDEADRPPSPREKTFEGPRHGFPQIMPGPRVPLPLVSESR